MPIIKIQNTGLKTPKKTKKKTKPKTSKLKPKILKPLKAIILPQNPHKTGIIDVR
jgi:hypothetical protein